MSKILFIIFIFFSILLFYLSDKKNNKFILILSIILISFIAGFRGINVGVDTKDYFYAFNNNFPRNWQFEELGFRYLSTTLMKIFKNPSYVCFIYSLITNFFIVFRLWDFRKKCNFTLMSFLYMLIYYVNTMNVMRQFLAVSIIFYSTKFLEGRKYLRFFIIVILMTLIHKSSLLALLLIFVYVWNSLSFNKKIAYIIPIIAIIFVGLYYSISFENDHITNYFSSQNLINNINITAIYRFLICIMSYLIIKSKIKFTFRYDEKNDMPSKDFNENEFNKYFFIYFMGLLFTSMGMFFKHMERFGYFYLCFELIYWGYIVKNYPNKKMYTTLISIYSIYVFALEIFTAGNEIFPFYFNF